MRSLKLCGLLIVPMLWAGPSPGANAPDRPARYLELEEIMVKGRKPANPQELTSWLSRLAGEFRYEGYVEQRGRNRAQVQGGSWCAPLGAPGLMQCVMNVGWQEPGAAASLAPAVALYGLYLERGPPGRDPDPRYIGHMEVDDRGLAESGVGQLFDDTLIYKAPCAELPGNCQRVVQVEAPPDGRIIRMKVQVQRDSQLEAQYVFEWHRIPQSPATSDEQQSATTDRAGSSIVPDSTRTWMRQLVGNFQTLLPGDQDCVLTPMPGKGCADKSTRTECRGIGSGPGVRCARDLGWNESQVPASRFKAGFQLWGYDAVAGRIVLAGALPRAKDGLGALQFHAGQLLDGKLTYTEPCYGKPACLTTRVTKSPDGNKVYFLSDIGTENKGDSIGITLTRIVDKPKGTAPEAPKVRNPSPRRP